MYTELRKRHVLEIAIVYLGVAWLFIEITEFVVGNYGFSRSVLDAVFLIAALGFPAFIVIAWFHGERGSQRVRRGELSLLLTLGVLGAIGTYRIATGQDADVSEPSEGTQVAAPNSDAMLAAADRSDPDLGRRSLAVLPFKNNVSDPELAWLGPGLADLLTTNFVQVEELRVVGRQSLYDLLTEEGRTESEEIPEALASTVARAAGAHMMLWGTVSDAGDGLVIDAQISDLDDGTVLAAGRARGTDVFVMVDSLTAALTREIAGDRRGPPPVSISRFGTRDLEALAAFQHGVQSERAGRRDEAALYYEQASEIDSTFVLPAIRLAGRRPRGGRALPEGVDPEDLEDFAFEGDDFEEINWAELDEEERREVREDIAARREASQQNAQVHMERALRMIEKLGVDDLGEALVARFEGMEGEDFVLMFDSTLSETLSSIVVVEASTGTGRDSIPF